MSSLLFHGYVHSGLLPPGWYMHEQENPRVACGAPEGAMYALRGKLGGSSNSN